MIGLDLTNWRGANGVKWEMVEMEQRETGLIDLRLDDTFDCDVWHSVGRYYCGIQRH